MGLAAHSVGQTDICRQGTGAVEAVGKVWSRDVISQTGGVGRRDDAPHFDSNLPTKLSGAWRADVDSSAHLLHELELLSNTSAAVSPPTNPPGQPPSANPPSVMRSKRMSSVSEQDHLNPRDPLYYAPRSLRERSATRGASLETPFSAVTFDSQLESAVSDALRHPLDPELMHEPDLESKKALWTVAARFAAAIGVAALVALFFVVAVPGSRQSDGDSRRRSPTSRSRSRTRCLRPERLRQSQRSTNSRPFSPPRRRALRRRPSRTANCSSSSCSGARSRIRPRHNAPTHNPDGGLTMPENRLTAILFSRSSP